MRSLTFKATTYREDDPERGLQALPAEPGKTATIDGKEMPLNKAPIGTVLTADVTVTETPVIDRTITTLKGKVWVAGPTSVILTLENGENKHTMSLPE